MRYSAPRCTRPARLSPLPALPVFLSLRERRAVVAGWGETALWKAEMLAAVGANAEVYAEAPCRDLVALASEPPAGRVLLIRRAWRASDLKGASLAIGSLKGREAEAFAAAARASSVPVNVVDHPQLSDFSFGTIVNRAPVTIAIGTDGTAPVLAQAIRSKMETLLNPYLGAWAEAARGERGEIRSRLPMGAARRAVWQRFAELALAACRPPVESEVTGILAKAPATAGLVTLIEAGPGDPELLTLKALRALQSADVIFYDRLINPEILELARREARRMPVGKTEGTHCTPGNISERMIGFAKSGKYVVRVKCRELGCAVEELRACQNAGIVTQIVAGVAHTPGVADALPATLLLQRTTAFRRHFRITRNGHGRRPTS